jgi:hypothetical protein
MQYERPNADPSHESEVVSPSGVDDIVYGVVEDGDRTFQCQYDQLSGSLLAIPVTPTMTRGWAAAKENTTAAKTDAKRTSLTPKLPSVFSNMSKEKARAGRMLDDCQFRNLKHFRTSLVRRGHR